ncbi:hypothetical protein G5V58_24655 [Nocardioides anomalus]|uniref:Uncharacterized protein n=1 Tax=Nocardioides anomalus TaxID=2712223 RepID=A0A6G6WK49_9ACTN|nr:hypothetical protein [Nocardioides anomalus]QIG45513.1 hypothetical protein G5V58_24655 [Nocardioides anomalus]
MGFVDELQGLIPQITEAAIEASMREAGYREGSCAEGSFRGAANLGTLGPGGEDNPMGFVPMDIKVTYPGGKWYLSPQYAEQWVPFEQTSWGRDGWHVPFDATVTYLSWGKSIDAVFGRWTYVPEPTDIEGKVDTLRAVAKQLNAGGAFTDGKGEDQTVDGGNLVLNDYIDYVDGELNQYNGLMIDAFDANYASRVRPTLTGQHVVACVMGTLIAGEQKIWEDAQEDVLTLAREALKAFKAAPEHHADWEAVFKVAGAALAAAGLFVTGGAGATAIGAASTVLGIIGTFQQPPPDKPKGSVLGSTSDAIIDSLWKSRDELDKAVTQQEQSLSDCGSKAAKYFAEHPEYIDIAEPSEFLENNRGEYFKDGENIKVLMPHLREIAARFDLISELQSAAAGQADGAMGDSVWTRDDRIGMSATGHYAAYQTLHGVLDGALSGSAREMHSVAGRLVQVSHDFQATEDQIEAELKQQTKQVQHTQPTY